MYRKSAVSILAVTVALSAGVVLADNWPQYANDADRRAVAQSEAETDLSTHRFLVNSLDFELLASPVVMNNVIYANAKDKIVAISERDGHVIWETHIDAGAYDSWSSPACDVSSDAVVIASNRTVYCLEADTGDIRWQQYTDLIIVNASPCIAEGSVFLADYHQFGMGTKLYCLDMVNGDITWAIPIQSCGGGTPAYFDGVVFIATSRFDSGEFAFYGGIACLDAADGTEEWHTELPWYDNSFHGGVCYSSGYVYGASYNFYGMAKLVKLDSADGELIWHADSERTDSVPVVADGKVFLSGGVAGYGSTPRLEAFDDATGAELWETALVGGWTHQPAFAGGCIYAGLIPESSGFGAYGNMHVLDISKEPGDDGFVVSVSQHAGGSPAIANGNVYSIGANGLYAFGPKIAEPRVLGDVDGDGCVNVLDLLAIRALLGKTGSAIIPPEADCSPDGVINVMDLLCVRGQLGQDCR